MVATPRSFLLFLFLASACLFKMATTYPHFGLERAPLAVSFPVLHNRTIASFKRQESEEDVDRSAQDVDQSADSVDLKACSDDPATCDLPIGTNKPRQVKEVAPVNPPGDLYCEPSPTAKYRDAHKSEVEEASTWFCEDFALKHPDQSWEEYLAILPITKTLWAQPVLFNFIDRRNWTEHDGPKNNVFSFRIDWIDGCKPDPRTGLDPLKPLNDFECQDVLFNSWQQCNNKGRGGAMTAGCFKYHIQTKF